MDIISKHPFKAESTHTGIRMLCAPGVVAYIALDAGSPRDTHYTHYTHE